MSLSPELAVSMIAALAGLWQVYVAKHAASRAAEGAGPLKKNALLSV